MTKLERALLIEQEEKEATPYSEHISIILNPDRLTHITCPTFYGMSDNCDLTCRECWNEPEDSVN